MKNVIPIVLRLASTLLLLAFLAVIYWIFNAYDWNYPLHKLACFTTLFAVIFGFQFLRSKANVPDRAFWAESLMLGLALFGIFFLQFREYQDWVSRAPVSDIGYTTVKAVDILVNQHENPYSRTDINNIRKDLDPAYHGFHYGPMMIVGYLPSAVFPVSGYKYISIFYVFVTIFLLILLIDEPDDSGMRSVANSLFVVTAYFLAERFWTELLIEGANDVFQIALILAALLALKKDRAFWAGLFTGLSFAAKFAPAMFLIPFMPVKTRNFWFGLACGFTPFIPFVFWDFAGLWRNAFWLRVVIPADWTSLYWITPERFHWIFGAILLTAVAISIFWALRRTADYRSALVGFTLLLIVADVTQKQIHGNHLIWFYPLFALLFMDYRERLFAVFSKPAENTMPSQ